MTTDRPSASDGTHDRQPEPAGGFGGRARLAVTWTAGFQLFRDVLQFGLMLVLVRILPPEVYGQFGFLTTLLGVLTLYSFREFLGHTLLVRDEGQVHYQDHFSAGIVLQLSVFVVANLIAIGLRWLPAYAEVAPVLHVMSVLFLFDLPSELRVKMLERRLDWRRLRVLHGGALVVGGAASVAMAVAGWGVYALILPTLVVPVVFAYDLFVRRGWRPTWQWSWERFRPAWRFGSARILSVSFVAGAGLVESSWLVGVAGFAVFGIFGRAISLTQLLCGRLAGLMAASVYPVLARIEPRTDTYRRASALYLRSMAWTVVPAAAVSSLLARPVVLLLYGSRWAEVIPMVPWAMAGGALMAVVQTGYTLLLAHQRQDRCLVVDVWRLVGTVMALAVLVPVSLNAYLGGLAVVHLTALLLVAYWLREDDAVTSPGLTAAFLPPLAGAGVATAIILVSDGNVLPASGVLASVLKGLIFAGAYVAVLRLLFRDHMRELINQLPKPEGLVRLLRLQQVA